MLGAKPLDDIPTHLLRAVLEPAELGRAEVGNAQRVERAGDRAPCPDVAHLRLHAVERRRVLAHEIFGPGRADEVGRESVLAESYAPRAVAVGVPTAIFRKTAFGPQHWSEPHPKGS